MPLQAIRKVVLWVTIFLAIYGTGAFASSALPSPWGLLSFVLWTALLAGAALFILDMTVPGVNLLASAPTRLPDAKKDEVALTFDDGPVEPYTRQILDVLDRHGAKATFFCLGANVDRNPGLAREIVTRGHTIANHTYGHRILPFLSPSDCAGEIERGADAIFRAGGVRPSLVRCPKGYKSRRTIRVAESTGAKVVGFSYPIFDVQNPPPEVLIDRVLSRVKAGDIILMHDGYAPACPGARSSLVEALPKILEGLAAKGLRTVTLDRRFWIGTTAAR